MEKEGRKVLACSWSLFLEPEDKPGSRCSAARQRGRFHVACEISVGLRERAAKFVTKALEARWMAGAMVCRSSHPGVRGESFVDAFDSG
ncbi:unnamed protein product [Sphagnum balticum]